jgi:hypothetical protein
MRYYSPQLMRWTQPDPLEGPSDFRQLNRYTYAGANPINSVDTLGLHPHPQPATRCPAVIEGNTGNCQGVGAGGFADFGRKAVGVAAIVGGVATYVGTGVATAACTRAAPHATGECLGIGARGIAYGSAAIASGVAALRGR